MKSVFLVVILVFCAGSLFAAPALRPHDCCWGPGCGLSTGIHGSETATLQCLNTSAATPPQFGFCETYEYRKPGYISMECDIAACRFTGQMKCPVGNGLFAYPSFNFDCPAVAGQLPIAGGGYTGTVQCLYPNSSMDIVASCSSDGLSVVFN